MQRRILRRVIACQGSLKLFATFPGGSARANPGDATGNCDVLQNGEADIGIASERLSNDPRSSPSRGFVGTIVCLFHSIILDANYTIDAGINSEVAVNHFRQGITGRSRIDDAFARKGLRQILY